MVDWMKEIAKIETETRFDPKKQKVSRYFSPTSKRNQAISPRIYSEFNIFGVKWSGQIPSLKRFWEGIKFDIKELSSWATGLFKKKTPENVITPDKILPSVDSGQKKTINVEDPEEDNDVVNKGWLEAGTFSGTFTNGDADTVTVVKGLITSVT